MNGFSERIKQNAHSMDRLKSENLKFVNLDSGAGTQLRRYLGSTMEFGGRVLCVLSITQAKDAEHGDSIPSKKTPKSSKKTSGMGFLPCVYAETKVAYRGAQPS